jgi:hypothetical protein
MARKLILSFTTGLKPVTLAEMSKRLELFAAAARLEFPFFMQCL